MTIAVDLGRKATKKKKKKKFDGQVQIGLGVKVGLTTANLCKPVSPVTCG